MCRILKNLRADRKTPAELPTIKRLEGVLSSVQDELKDVPLYYVLPDLFSCLHSQQPAMLEITSAIKNAGYNSSRFHNEPKAIKTDAPNYVVWDIMRAYCRLNPPKSSKNKEPSSSSLAILAKPSRTVVDFRLDNSLKIPQGRFVGNTNRDGGPGRKKRTSLPLIPAPDKSVNAESTIVPSGEDAVGSPDEIGPSPSRRFDEGDSIARQREKIKETGTGGITYGKEKRDNNAK